MSKGRWEYDLSFKDAIGIANKVGITEEKATNDSIILFLKDGSQMHFTSEYGIPYSDATRGKGIQPPTVARYWP